MANWIKLTFEYFNLDVIPRFRISAGGAEPTIVLMKPDGTDDLHFSGQDAKDLAAALDAEVRAASNATRKLPGS